MKENTTPIFVLGSPRSGTTMLGALIGSDERVLYLNELAAFYFSYWIADQEYERVISDYKNGYLKSLQKHSLSFVNDLCSRRSLNYFVEDTPWNFRIVRQLNDLWPNAHFVLSYRTCSKVVESMRKSFQSGYRWAGPDDESRILLWSEAYSCVKELPKERTLLFSYDFYMASPKRAVEQLKEHLGLMGLPSQFDVSVLAKRHASDQGHGNLPVAVSQGKIVFRAASMQTESEAMIDQSQALPAAAVSVQNSVLSFKRSLSTLGF